MLKGGVPRMETKILGLLLETTTTTLTCLIQMGITIPIEKETFCLMTLLMALTL